MSKNTLLTLLAILVVAVGAVVLLKNRERTPSAGAAGEALLPSLDPAKIEKVAVSFGGQTALLERGADGWAVASLFGYPVDFPRLRESLTELIEVKGGSVVRGGTDSLADFGLATDATTVALLDSSGAPLLSVSLGRPRGGGASRPGGRYLRVGDGPVVLAKEDLARFSANSDEWIDKKVLEVNSPLTRRIKITLPEASYTLDISGENKYRLEDQKEDEKIDQGAAARLARALPALRCLSVADPALSDAELGLESPSSYTMEAKDGFAYTVRVGGASADPAGRYARVSVSYSPPPPPTREEVAASLPPEKEATPSEQTGDASGSPPPDRLEAAYADRLKAHEDSCARDGKRAAELQAKLAKWTFVIPAPAAETLTMARAKLLLAKEQAPPEQK